MNWMSWQIDYLLLLQNFRDFSHHIFDNFFILVSKIGLTKIILVLLFFVYWCYNKKIGMYMIYCFAISYMMNIFLKMTACIYRPYFLDSRLVPLEHPTGYSFPSGHTARVTSCLGSFAFVFWKNKWIRYSSIVIIFLVMFSRNYLGVHTPQDVIVSFIITFLLVFIIKLIFDIAETKKYGFLVLTFVTAILCILLIVYLNFKTYPIDYINGKIVYDATISKLKDTIKIFNLLGLMFGCYLEIKILNFDPTKGGIIRKILRVLIGILVLMLIENQFKSFLYTLMDHQIAKCIDSFIAGFFLTFLYPCLIKFFNFVVSKKLNNF